jgi:predicted lipoprotein
MFNKVVKYFLITFFIGFIAYHAVYFKKLSSIKESEKVNFDAKTYANDYVLKKIPSIKNKALDIFNLLSELEKDPNKILKNDTKSPATSDVKYFFIGGKAKISEINKEYILLKNSQNDKEIKLAIKYIFGNSARDCSGLISINDFTNTMDLNNVSEEINKLIRKEIIDPFLLKVKKGDLISFTGAVEISMEEPKLSAIEIIPLTLVLQPSKP